MDDLESRLTNLLEDELAARSIALSDEQCHLMINHLFLVIEKNKEMNLTRILSPEEAIHLHLVDSLLMLPWVGKEGSRLLDIGTGAGFPGIPLAIASGCNAVLLDSTAKKIAAVNEFIRTLHLEGQIETSNLRVEEYALNNRSGFDTVCARAVAGLPVLVEYATPLLKKHGQLVVTKGRPSADEVEQGDAAAKICGLKRTNIVEENLSDDRGHRTLVVYEKIASPRVKLPRAVGKAKSEPLGRQ